jgi:hypothetical protein
MVSKVMQAEKKKNLMPNSGVNKGKQTQFIVEAQETEKNRKPRVADNKDKEECKLGWQNHMRITWFLLPNPKYHICFIFSESQNNWLQVSF